jgi:phage I-like protein
MTDLVPPKGAQEAARRALEVRAKKPPSERGMTAVGIARARDLANGKALSPETVRRMVSFFARHEVDKQGSTWDEQGKGWQAWHGWGGDAGYAWARKVVEQMDSRQMSCPITMSADPVSQSVIQVARCGTFDGHSQGGFAFDAATFDALVRNFEATENRRVPIDYEHATEMTGAPGVLQHGAPAVGWVTHLESRGDAGLFAHVDWVDPQAVERIRMGQYAYCSPAVVFGAIDPESGAAIGPKLTSVALTNRPFLDGMAALTARDPIAASLAPESVHVPTAVAVKEDKTMEPEKMKSHLAGLAMKMGMDPEAAEDQIIAAIEALLEKFEQNQMMEAMQMSDRVIADGRAPAASRDRLAKLCRADRPTFDALFPAVEAPASDAKLMSARVSPQGGVPASRVVAPVRHADAADDRAAKLMSDHGLSYKDALLRASRDLRDEALAPLTAALGG